MTAENVVASVAERLRDAERTVRPLAPFAHELGAGDVTLAYSVQRSNVRHWTASGRRGIGRKIGLTSKTVQQQLGVDQPDYGTLFADMEAPHGGNIELERLIAPRVEAEIALVLERGITAADPTISEVMRAVAFAVPALEVVDSRIEGWRISIVDTIADNGASARYVLGMEPRRLQDLDLEACGMVLTRNGETASVGVGAACLGHPLNAALWLARTMVAHGEHLQAGDMILTGALGPMVEARSGDVFETRIAGLSPVRLRFS